MCIDSEIFCGFHESRPSQGDMFSGSAAVASFLLNTTGFVSALKSFSVDQNDVVRILLTEPLQGNGEPCPKKRILDQCQGDLLDRLWHHQQSPHVCQHLLKPHKVDILVDTMHQSCSQTPPSYEEKRSGEPSRISWASARFCDIVTQQRSKHFADNPFKKRTDTRMEMSNFTVVRAVLRNNY